MEEIRARIWEEGGRWRARTAGGAEVSAATREDCLHRLRNAVGREAVLTVEAEPVLVGVAEAADVLGWDKRRIFTYLGRGAFPEPVAELASGRVWRRSDIEAFSLTRTRRSSPAAPTPGNGDGDR